MAQHDRFDAEKIRDAERTTARGAPRVRAAARDQVGLEVVDLDPLIPEDHPARILWAAVERLDLRRFDEANEARVGPADVPAPDPGRLVGLWLYATVEGSGQRASWPSCAGNMRPTSGSAAASASTTTCWRSSASATTRRSIN